MLILALGPGGGAIAGTTYTFQQGVNGYTGCLDTHIREADPNGSYGASETLVWDFDDPNLSGSETVALLQFSDIFGAGPGQIPPGSAITSATLTYNLVTGDSVSELAEVLIAWDESSTHDGFGIFPGAQVGDYRKQPIGSPSGIGIVRTLNVTESVVRWSLNPASNHGWIFFAESLGAFGIIHSSESTAGVALRPLLTVVVNDTATPTLVRAPYLQAVTPTSITVCWRTDQWVDSVVRYGLSPDNLDQTVTVSGDVRDHFVTLENLAPGQRHYYEIGWSGGTLAGGDADHSFLTLPDAPTDETRTIWVVGDSGVGNAFQTDVRDAMLGALGGAAPDMTINLGDVAYVKGTDGEYTDFHFAPYAQVLQQSPQYATPGDHDLQSIDIVTLAGTYYDSFVFPTMGEAGGTPSMTEEYYSFDIGGAHFISLASFNYLLSNQQGPMYQWLQADLAAAADADWIIAFLHHPPYSNGTHNSNNVLVQTRVRERIVPLLEAGGVDLVMAGFSHSYERSYLVDGAYETPSIATGKILDAGDGDPAGDGAYQKPPGITSRAGAVYVVAGHGWRSSIAGPHPLIQFGEAQPGSCLLSFDRETLLFRNVRIDGVISDTFAIHKALDCPPDLVANGVVDGADLAAFLTMWGETVSPSDFNGDANVDGSDLAALLAAWGPCAQ